MNRTAIALAVGLLLGAPAFAQSNDELKQLRETLRELQQRITQLEQAKAAQPAAAASGSPAVVTQGDIPNSWKLPGTDTSVSIGGIVSVVAVHGNRTGAAASTADISLLPVAIPLSGTAGVRTDYWKLNSQDSTLRVRTYTPTQYGPITSLVEGDFYGGGGTEIGTNGYGFRLKHAWFTLGNFGFGQYWSNATNFGAYPESVEDSPDMGLFGALRQPQIRYTHPLGEKNFWSVAVENPESVIVVNSSNSGASTTPDNDRSPDLNGKFHFALGSGEFELAGVARKLTSAPGATQQSKWGFGVGFSGFVNFGARDKVQFAIGSSRGAGREQVGYVQDAVLIGTDLKAVNAIGGLLSLKHYWTPTLRSNLTYSFVNIDNPAGISSGTAAGLNKEFRASHLNLIWSATPKTEFGAEVLYGSRQVESGVKGSLSRFVVAGRYYF